MPLVSHLFRNVPQFLPKFISFLGLEDWGEDAVLHQVLAASHQEYLDSLKSREGGEGPSHSHCLPQVLIISNSGETEGGTEPTVHTPEDQNTN